VAGRTREEARDSYIGPLRRTLSCVTERLLYFRASEGDPEVFALLLQGDPVTLRTRPPITLSIKQRVRVIAVPDDPGRGPFEAQTVAYTYKISELDGAEIVSYHWRGEVPGVPPFPHMHVRTAATPARPGLGKVHFPTDRVAVEDVVWLVISEFGAPKKRGDWAMVLDENRGGLQIVR
jgi:hypothetical protein